MKFFQQYLEEKFSKKFYRIPVDIGLKCPLGNNIQSRCFFCDEDGSRPAHLRDGMPLAEQVQKGVNFVRKNYGERCGLIGYIQAHTGTNASASELRKLYRLLLSLEKIECLIVATRPDALPKESISLLAEFSKEIELWVELGVQTANDTTLRLINRKHDFAAVKDSVLRLDSKGINTAAHLILGLPGEGICDFRRTAEKISSLPFKAVKIHNLLVLKNTIFEQWFHEGKIKTMNERQYAAVLIDFIRKLRKDIYLMRICADADEKKLIAPNWSMTKNQFLEMIKSMLDEEVGTKFSKTLTADGSWTLWHPVYKEYYRSLYGAKSESQKIFTDTCEIRKKLNEKKTISILEIGFGLGLNLVETLSITDSFDENEFSLEFISLEKDLSGLENSLTLEILPSEKKEIFKTLLERKKYKEKNLRISIIEGDARISIKKILRKFDAVYLDPFSPEKNLEMWTYDFIREITRRMKDDAILSTYSSAFPVRGAMFRCSLRLGDIQTYGRRRAGTAATFAADLIRSQLTEKESNIILKTTAAVPYRDIGLSGSSSQIKERRAKLVAKLRKKGIPKWLKL